MDPTGGGNDFPLKSSEFVDVFSFDDMMMACCQEVMVNGLETTSIPETVKDWISGKLLRSLPKKLVQRLMSFIISQRDIEGCLGFRENQHAEVPEFTLLQIGCLILSAIFLNSVIFTFLILIFTIYFTDQLTRAFNRNSTKNRQSPSQFSTRILKNSTWATTDTQYSRITL